MVGDTTGIATWWLEKGKPISAREASLQIARDFLPDYLLLIETQKTKGG